MSATALPLSWRKTTLGEVAAPVPNAIVDGPFGSNLKLSDYVEEGIPVLQGKNITNDSFRWFDVRFISDRKATELKRSSVRVGDILIIKIGSIGYSAIVEDLNGFEFAIIPANLAKVTPDATKVDLGYLHKWLTSVDAKRYLNSVASKTAQPALSLGKIKSLPLPMPPLAEQRRIAEVLDRAEALRAQRRAALAQLDSLTQSLFLDLFGDPYQNPKNWPQVRLDAICKLINGRAFKPEDWEKEGLPIVRIQNLNDPTKPFNYTSKPFAEKVRVRPGDILFSWSGTPGTSFGCFRWRGPEGCLNQHIFNVRLNGDIDGEFFICHMNLKLGELIGKAHGGVGLQHVTKGMVDETMLMLPPIPLQREFARRVTAVEALKTAQRASLAELDALFATLQHRAFRGEL